MSSPAPVNRRALLTLLGGAIATPWLPVVAVELEKYEVIGPGIIVRVCSGLQREHINRPRTRWLLITR
jgi:hypothetical protein